MIETKDDEVLKGNVHTSVLLHEVIEGLAVKNGETFVDMTTNGGGHSSVVCPLLGEKGMLIGIDADANALAKAKEKLSECRATIHLVPENFRNISAVLKELGIEKVDKVLFDLGLSSNELENSGRGFSFQKDEPLLMTFSNDPSKVTFTAEDIVNTWDEENIATILSGYGEERFAKRIAERIVEARGMQKIHTTKELVGIIQLAVPGWYRSARKIHFATKTFQALRMAVNDEIRALEEALNSSWEALSPGGRIAIISFHSTEDRLVKKFFKEKAKEGEGILITKKPIVPSEEELKSNKRARSAKLRIIEKSL
ncbi:MAG: 16S rRNA (cytosine(1402)-N(4))-methyltransferase RsmH [Candidatus Parcubacteria bacterium]|nr:16S rRNA (cytosine(1402)-N(4))-methyltransferase RsmH [Candidatus Parcubacteria bacterium]